MTQDEIIEIYIEVSNKLCNGTEWCWAGVGEPLQLFAKLVAEKALREALAQPKEQEPVAYLSNKRQRLNIELKPQTFVEIPTATDWEMPLYMKPPQRTWVDLTRAQFAQILCDDRWQGRPELMMLQVQAKLKEKNT